MHLLSYLFIAFVASVQASFWKEILCVYLQSSVLMNAQEKMVEISGVIHNGE